MKPYIKVKSLSLLRPLSLSVTSAKAACACELDTERATDYHYCLSKQKSHGEEIPATKQWTTYRSFMDLTQDSDDADRGDEVQVVPSSGCSIISLIFFRVIFYESILPKQGRFYLEIFFIVFISTCFVYPYRQRHRFPHCLKTCSVQSCSAVYTQRQKHQRRRSQKR